ncbi:MAG: adenylyltransferase/cytidyltransferase family protein [bacterium]
MKIFNEKHLTKKIVLDYWKLKQIVTALRSLGYEIVVTIGSYDMLHIGHVRYLNKARSFGDLLVVGVDSDNSIKKYKGEHRPIIPEQERLEMLSYQSSVDLVTVIDDMDNHGDWQYKLLKLLKPDIFVAMKESYPPKQLKQIRKYCHRLIVLPRQAENTSSTKVIQEVMKKQLPEIKDRIRDLLKIFGEETL